MAFSGLFDRLSVGLKIAVGAVISALIVGSSAADEFQFIDNAILDARTRAEMPLGTAIVAFKGNEVVYEGCFGHADIAADR